MTHFCLARYILSRLVPTITEDIFTLRFSKFRTFLSTSEIACWIEFGASTEALFSGFVEAAGILQQQQPFAARSSSRAY